MDQLAIARKAIEDEVAALSAEIDRLNGVLAILDRAGAPKAALGVAASTTTTTAPKKRGRPATPQKAKAAKASDAAIVTVLKVIKDAGKSGIKALSLASHLKKAGVPRPSKVELLESGSVKTTGAGGGTTYHYAG